MKLTLDTKTLLDTLALLKPIASGRASLPGLSAFALVADGETLELSANDTDKALKIVLSAQGEKGAIAINANRLLSALGAFGAGPVTLSADSKHMLTVSRGSGTVKRAGFAVKDMPASLTIEPIASATLPQKQLRAVLRKVLPFVSTLIVANGLQGTYLHLRGIAQRPGGWTRYNVEGGPPVFAPLLASLVGGMGLLAAVLRREEEPA